MCFQFFIILDYVVDLLSSRLCHQFNLFRVGNVPTILRTKIQLFKIKLYLYRSNLENRFTLKSIEKRKRIVALGTSWKEEWLQGQETCGATRTRAHPMQLRQPRGQWWTVTDTWLPPPLLAVTPGSKAHCVLFFITGSVLSLFSNTASYIQCCLLFF